MPCDGDSCLTVGCTRHLVGICAQPTRCQNAACALRHARRCEKFAIRLCSAGAACPFRHLVPPQNDDDSDSDSDSDTLSNTSVSARKVKFVATVLGDISAVNKDLLAEFLYPATAQDIKKRNPGKFDVFLSQMNADQLIAAHISSKDQRFFDIKDGSEAFSIRVSLPKSRIDGAARPMRQSYTSKLYYNSILSETRALQLFPEAFHLQVQVQGQKRDYSLLFKSKAKADACYNRVSRLQGASVQAYKVDFVIDGRAYSLLRSKEVKEETIGGGQHVSSGVNFSTVERSSTAFMNARIIDDAPRTFSVAALKAVLSPDVKIINFPTPTMKSQLTRITFEGIDQANAVYQARLARIRNSENHPIIVCESQGIELLPPVQNYGLRIPVVSEKSIVLGQKSLSGRFVPASKKYVVYCTEGELDIITIFDSSSDFLDRESLATENIKIDYLYTRQVELKRISNLHKCGFRFTRLQGQKQRLEVFGLLTSVSLARRECQQLANGVALKAFTVGPAWKASPHFAKLLENFLSGFTQLRVYGAEDAIDGFKCSGPLAALQELQDALDAQIPLAFTLTLAGANQGLLSPEKVPVLNGLLHPIVLYEKNGANKMKLFALSQDDLDVGIRNVTSWQAQAIEDSQPKEEKINVDSPEIFKFITAHQQTWTEIKTICDSHSLAIRKPRAGNEDDQFLAVNGKKKDLALAVPKLQAKIAAVAQSFASKTSVLTPGNFGVFEDSLFQAELAKAVDLRGVSIGIVDDESEPLAVNLLRQVTVNGITIEIRQGDIVNDADVDAIVIAAGSHLEHGGGVAARVALAAGPDFISDCKSYILKNKSLAETKSCAFDARNLNPVETIIASVPPVFFPTTDRTVASRELLETFKGTFAEASSAGVKRLATPALGAKLFNNPTDLVLDAFFKAISQLSPPSTLSTIRMTDIDPALLKQACALFDAQFKAVSGYRSFGEPDNVDRVKVKQPKYLWEVQIKEQGIWRRYDDDSHAIIDSNYQLDAQSIFDIFISISDSAYGRKYKIDFNKMEQINIESNFPRKIRFVPNPAALELAKIDEGDAEIDDDRASKASSNGASKLHIKVSYLATELDAKLQLLIRMIAESRLWADRKLKSHSATFVINKDLEETISLACKNNLVDFNLMIDGKTVQLKGTRERVIDMVEIVSPLINPPEANALEFKFPPHWSKPQPDPLMLVSLASGCPEWNNVDALLRKTMPAIKVHSLARIQNQTLWSNFQHNIQRMKQRLGHEPTVTQMFHGTSSNDPKVIYGDIHHDGFHTNLSRAGMWGRGTYFAVNASYSGGGYSFTAPGGQKQMMLCQVLVGDTIKLPSDSSIALAPIKPGAATERYDSVTGNTGGSDVVIVYDNGRAYPEYLITFTN